LLSVAPFLLIYVFPWIRRNLFERSGEAGIEKTFTNPALRIDIAAVLEAAGQVVSILLFLWIVFGPLVPKQYFYLAFVPIIWMVSSLVLVLFVGAPALQLNAQLSRSGRQNILNALSRPRNHKVNPKAF